HAGDEARARDRRPLKPGRLKHIARRQQEPEPDAPPGPRPPEPAESARGGPRESGRGDREPHREEREKRIDLDGVLDLDERHAPYRGHGDQRGQREHRVILLDWPHEAWAKLVPWRHCATRGDGRSSPCGSPSRTSATSAAR